MKEGIKAQDVLEKLIEKKLTLSSCESFTGGLFSNTFTNAMGSSEVFKGALVAYSNEAKMKIAKVNQRTIKKYGAVSPEASKEMALGTNKLFKTDVCVSFTGNADKNVIENSRPFSGYLTVAYHKTSKTYEINTDNNKHMSRELFKEIAVNFALNKILDLI